MNPNAAAYVPGQGFRLLSVPAAPAPAAAAPAPAPVAVPAPAPVAASTPAPAPVAAAPAPTPTPAASAPAPVKEAVKEAPAPVKEEEKGKEKEEEAEIVIDEKVEEDDPRDHLNLVFIGHVDAGKSTISGNILYLTGQVDERTIAKYEREAKEKNRGTWFLAYIMDTNEEERNRGKTVEVGRAHFETEKKRYTILDAPGHKNYVPNMIGGAAQADVAVLVISAKTGEFESGFEKGGQTREHAMLVKTLGVRHLVVAVNKMDEPQIKWGKDRYDEIVTKLSAFLKKEAQWQPKDTYFLPISGFTGLNLMKPLPKEECPWWEGKTMVEYLDDLKLGERGQSDALRIPVMDKYKDSGLLNIIGKVESGTVSRGQTIYAMPNKIAGKVVGVYIAEKPVNRARAGENIRISITGIDENDVAPGFVVCGTNNLCPVVTEFIAQIVIMELLPANPLFTAGYEAVIHIHTGVRECNVVELLREIDKKTRQPIKKKVMFVKDGGVVIAKFQVNAPICLELFDQFPQLGRFTLRDKGKTIAIGKVVKLGTK